MKFPPRAQQYAISGGLGVWLKGELVLSFWIVGYAWGGPGHNSRLQAMVKANVWYKRPCKKKKKEN